jgi:WD40 repeat protein
MPGKSLVLRFTFLLLVIFTVRPTLLAQTGKVPHKARGVWTLDWSPDDRFFALGGDDSTLAIYNTGDYSLYRSLKLPAMIKCLRWHPREKLLAIATNKDVSLLEMATNQLRTLPGLSTGGRGLSWNYTGELLALADGRGVVQILTKEGALVRSIKKHNNHSYLAVDFHPSKNILVASSDEILVFDTSGRQLSFITHRNEPTGVLSVRWHPSGTFFASGDYGHHGEGVESLLQFWKEDGTLLKVMKGSTAEYRNIRWNKDGSLLATASDALRVWTKEGELVHTGSTTGYNLWSIDWNTRGSLILTSSFDGHLDLWTQQATRVRKID